MNNITLKFDVLEEGRKNHLKHEWQAFAYKIWHDLGGEDKELPNLMRLVKLQNTKYRNLLDRAYSYSIDYAGAIPRLMIFYWSFWKFKKHGRIQQYEG